MAIYLEVNPDGFSYTDTEFRLSFYDHIVKGNLTAIGPKTQIILGKLDLQDLREKINYMLKEEKNVRK